MCKHYILFRDVSSETYSLQSHFLFRDTFSLEIYLQKHFLFRAHFVLCGCVRAGSLIRPVDIVVPGIVALLIVEFANLIYPDLAQSPLQLGSLALLGAVVIQGERFDVRGKVGRISGRGGSSADEIAVALLSGGAADFVSFPIALLALFAAITGCWIGAASASKSLGISA